MELKKYKLGEIGEIRMCKRILKSETNPYFGIPFYKIGTFGKIADAFIDPLLYKHYKKSYSFPRKGDVLISAAGTIGKSVIYNGEDAYFQDSNIVWIEHDQSIVLNEFLYYLLNSIQWIPSKGSTIFRLYNDDIRNKEVFIPSIKEQREIVSVLSSIDRKIELNRAINQNLEAMAKQLYDYWFVQFDFPNEDGKPYKSSGGEMVWNEKLKRNIPVGWHCGNLFEIAVFTNGLACQKFRAKDDEESLPVIKIREMHDGISDDTEEVTSNIPESVKVYNGDVLFSWSASLEVMLWAYGLGGLNQHIFKVTSANDFPKSFYYFQLLDYIDVFKKVAEARKTTMGHITQDHLQQSTIAIPDNKDIAVRFEELISPIFEQVVKLHEEISNLTKQRNELLPLLMNAQVSVNSDLAL